VGPIRSEAKQINDLGFDLPSTQAHPIIPHSFIPPFLPFHSNFLLFIYFAFISLSSFFFSGGESWPDSITVPK
jgi:hypothetical protein